MKNVVKVITMDSSKTISEEKDIKKAVRLDEDNIAIRRIKERCIDCGRCKTVCENLVGIKYDYTKTKEAVCINCGQCILNCPVGALVPKYDYKNVLDYLHDTNKTVTISIAPAVRTSIGEGFGLEAGTFLEKQLVGSLKEAGFDYVFDVTFGADMTVVEEATELIERLKTKKNLPQFTSCCPAWVKYLEIFHENLRKNLSTTKSPIGILSSLLNTYFLKIKELDKKDVINVVVVPCTAKKFEIKRTEMGMDIAITTSELIMLLKESNIDINKSKEENFDEIFSKGSGSGVIFGSSGGVLEATLRCADYLLTGKENNVFLDFKEIRSSDKIKEANVKVGNYHLKVAAISGMPSFETILPKLNDYDFIEVMNCPNGCVGGGGQTLVPIAKQQGINLKRSEGLYQDDKMSKIKISYKNPDVINIYKTYLDYPGSPKALKLLHTNFKDRSSILKEKSF